VGHFRHPLQHKESDGSCGYATPNRKVFELLPPEVQKDPVAYPPNDVLQRCQVYIDIGSCLAEYNRAWTEIKGQ